MSDGVALDTHWIRQWMECTSGLDALEERKLLCPAGNQTILACVEGEALRNILICSEGGSKWAVQIITRQNLWFVQVN